jgi:uncharacterized protein (DUF885 family)
LLAVAVALSACAPGPTTRPTPLASDSARFEDFTRRYLDGEFRPARDPGDPQARLRPEADRSELNAAQTVLQELHAIDTARLATVQRIDWLLVEARAKRTIADTVLRQSERVPARYITVGGIYWQVAGDADPTAEDWAEALQTLERQPGALAVGRERLVDPPPLWAWLAEQSAAGFVEFLDGEFVERTREAPDTLRERLVAAAGAASAALEAYVAFLSDTLEPGGDDSWAVGSGYYDWVLREVNFLPFTAETMIAEGYRIHEETKAALDSLARTVDGGKSWSELVQDMQGRHPEPGSILAEYERESRRVEALLVRENLIRIPPCEDLLLVPTPPALRETYAWGGYGGIRDRDDVMIGRFFVTDVVPGMTPQQVDDKLRAQNLGWIAVIALHEGYPGHHLQNVYARSNGRRLRRRFGNTYYGEGWALYAEHWMQREGLFINTDQQLAQLQMRLWRTARVIIDPSLHTGRMSYQEAVQFFMDEVGLTRSAAEAEVNRYTTWPTQAPSYIIGWLEIEKLKAELATELGERFEEKRFHETLLEQGSLPLALLRRAMWEAMADQPAPPPASP